MPLSAPAAVYTAYLAEAGGALLVALAFHSFYRRYPQGHLRQWSYAWLALSARMLYAGLGAVATAAWPQQLWLRVVAAVGVSLAGWSHLAWLAGGTAELTTGRVVSRRQKLGALLLAAAAVVAVIVVGRARVPERPLALDMAVRAALGAAVLPFAAYALWRLPRRPGIVGAPSASAALLAYALLEAYAALRAAVSGATPFDRLYLADVIALAVQLGLAGALVVSLLEAERQAAYDAASAAEHLAYHDALTGLPNRQLFHDRLVVAIANAHRARHKLAVFFLDLDRFKIINDSLGHAAGDALLRAVASRVTTHLRENDTVARLGGDEFTILSPRIDGGEDAITIAHKVRDAVEAPVAIEGRELFVTTSIGISIYPDDGETAETLLRNADAALYRAKARGRDTFELYRPAMNARALEQLALESAMRRALANDEFVVHYQPIVDVASGTVLGTEALLRWQHPELGLLAPDDFIFLAEVTGLVVPVGEHALRTACAQTRAWQLAGRPSLHASVNLSVRQLQQHDFVERVARALDDSGLPASCLELEVTESIAMHSAEHSADGTIAKLRALKRLGVRIAIDDFGTGYSSLSVLRLFPVDALKIDRSFVRDVGAGSTAGGDSAAIASAVIALGHSLNLSVIAEGVETPEQLRFLADQQCDSWQGFLAAPAVPADACARLLRLGEGEAPAMPVPVAADAPLPQP